MADDTQPSRYRCVAADVEGFIQQVAVSYIRTGHFFYVSGTLAAKVNAAAVDAKLIHKYGIDVSRWGRALRKSRGEANLQYIRHDRFFLLMATHGKSLFFELEGDQVHDCRRQPIKCAGYSISYRGGHPHVRIDLETYLGYKAQMVGESLRWNREMLETALSLPEFVPYAPVRRQLWHVFREMNRVRAAAGLDPLRQECLNLRRRIVKPFGDGSEHTRPTNERSSHETAGLPSAEDGAEGEWSALDGPAREFARLSSLLSIRSALPQSDTSNRPDACDAPKQEPRGTSREVGERPPSHVGPHNTPAEVRTRGTQLEEPDSDGDEREPSS